VNTDKLEKTMFSTNTTESTPRMPASLPAAVAVANHYLRPSLCPVEVIDPNDRSAFGQPATMQEIGDTTKTVLEILESGEYVEAGPCGSRVTADGDEYFVTIDHETPEHLVEVAGHAIISAIHLRRAADEAMNRAIVALSLTKPALGHPQ